MPGNFSLFRGLRLSPTEVTRMPRGRNGHLYSQTPHRCTARSPRPGPGPGRPLARLLPEDDRLPRCGQCSSQTMQGVPWAKGMHRDGSTNASPMTVTRFSFAGSFRMAKWGRPGRTRCSCIRSSDPRDEQRRPDPLDAASRRVGCSLRDAHLHAFPAPDAAEREVALLREPAAGRGRGGERRRGGGLQHPGGRRSERTSPPAPTGAARPPGPSCRGQGRTSTRARLPADRRAVEAGHDSEGDQFSSVCGLAPPSIRRGISCSACTFRSSTGAKAPRATAAQHPAQRADETAKKRVRYRSAPGAGEEEEEEERLPVQRCVEGQEVGLQEGVRPVETGPRRGARGGRTPSRESAQRPR